MALLRKLFVLLLLPVVLSSCAEQPFYEKTVSFEGGNWDQRLKPAFKVDVQDLNKEYTFVISLRTTTDYKFSNLWIYLNTTTPDGNNSREPFQIQITDSDGAWLGEKTGTIVENNLIFPKRKLPMTGKYIFSIEQGITSSKIEEVLDIALLVEKGK
jgi:gliding motility-associated lipoprotein GldH